jgi:hypothetical protein
VLVLAAVGCLSVVGPQPAAPAPLASKSVRICHATSSQSSPYTPQEPAIANNGDLQGGHLNHTGPVFPAADWGDIIPPYTYVDAAGVTQTFPGYNWTPEGQAIWENDCKPGKSPLTPMLECVEPAANGGFLAHFGYDNPNSSPIVDPFENAFSPEPADRGQPTTFQPGRVKDAFQVESSGGLTWMLTGNQVTATSNSTPCQGSITIVKILHPSDDPGRFNLEIGGQTAGGAEHVGDGATTGSVAVSAGSHVVGESASPGTSLADYDTQIECVSGGSVVAQSGTATVDVTVRRGEDVTCTITNTRRSTPNSLVTPVVECVVFKNGVPDQAVWGYENDNDFAVALPIGQTNGFVPAPEDRGQPTVFEPGRWDGVFQTPFDGAATLTWTVADRSATASSSSDRCTATLELRKVTVPSSDPGIFNLLVDGAVLATGGNGTTTGPITVGVGDGTVRETAGPGTSLADYDSTVDCTRNGVPVLSLSGTKVDGTISNGDVVVCTFTNRLRPTPTPPTPPPSGDQVDLAIVKTATPTTVVVGQNITWTVTVTNESSVDAPNVNVVRVSERSYRTTLVSLTPSQGTCGTGGCDLGHIGPGASATITAVTKATQVGEILNVVRVGSEEQESNYLNNTASALARVIGPLRPPLRPLCRTLGAEPRLLRAGATSIVLATALNRFGAPVPGVRVQLLGLGLRRHAETNARGIARFTVTPGRTGLVRFQGAPRIPAGRTSCTTFLAVLKAAAAGVTG